MDGRGLPSQCTMAGTHGRVACVCVRVREAGSQAGGPLVLGLSVCLCLSVVRIFVIVVMCVVWWGLAGLFSPTCPAVCLSSSWWPIHPSIHQIRSDQHFSVCLSCQSVFSGALACFAHLGWPVGSGGSVCLSVNRSGVYLSLCEGQSV